METWGWLLRDPGPVGGERVRPVSPAFEGRPAPPGGSRAHSATGDPPLYSIPIENILAVEPLEEESFKMKNVSATPSPRPRRRPRLAPAPRPL